MPEEAPPLSPLSVLPPRPAKPPMRSRAAALVIKIISPILAVYLLIELVANTDDWRMWFVGPVVLGFGVLLLYGVAHSLSSRDAWETMQQDSRPPVVYLRPFRHDSHMRASAPEGVREGGVMPDTSHASSSHENAISKALTRLGPFVAVGQPGERLMPVGGASRLYLSDENWKQVVESLVRRAAAIVLQPESTEGTLWEVILVARAMNLRRVLLVVPNSQLRPLGFARICGLIRERLNVVLPDFQESTPCDAFYFDRELRPVPISLAHDATAALAPFVDLVLELNGSEAANASVAELPLG